MWRLTNRQNFFQSAGLSAGTVFNSLLGFVFYILVARILGLSGFGYFSYLLGLGLLASELGDLGLGSALVKFGAQERFPAIFSLATLQRIAVGVIITAVFFVASIVLGDHLQIYGAAVGVSLLFVSLVTQSFLARQKYMSYVFVNIFGNTIRLALTYYLVVLGLLKTVSALTVFSLANAAAFIMGIAILWINFRWQLLDFTSARRILREVVNYCRWLALSYGIASLTAKIDIPILYLLGGAAVTGIYSSAQKLLSVFAQVAAALEGVFSPKLSTISQQTKAFRDYILISFLASLGMLATIIVSGIVIPLVFGNKYLEAIPAFNWMLVGMVFFFLSGPFTAVVLYQKGKSVWHLTGSAMQLIVSIALYFGLIPRFGIWGAVTAYILGQIFNFSYYLVVWQYVRHRS
ncbi:oligosaccharide flippase family protein [Patescibacteria group bacterium]|nr:oligosaccharide flippase family protein [Patescibacteria group bacterium]